MFFNLIYLTTAIFGYITIYLIGFKFKSNRNTNLFLVIFFFLSSTRFFFIGMLNVPFFANNLYFFNAALTLTTWNCLYLYFTHLIQNKTEIKAKEGLHFIIPLFLLSLAVFQFLWTDSAVKTLTVIAIGIISSMNLIYFLASYKILSKNIWNRKSEIALINKQNKAITKWTTFLFVVFSLLTFIFIIRFFVPEEKYLYLGHNNYLWILAFIWIYIYLKILSDPQFLYGHDVLQSKVKEYKKYSIVFDNIWKLNYNLDIVNVQDAILKEKIQNNIEFYIVEIEHLALRSNLFFKEAFSAEDLANKLSIPKSHLLYVFKYHSNVSFSDFKKIIRIERAITLMEQDYLKSNTMESLAIDVGFSSYSPFFKSFKTITGLSPQEYYNKVK
jgi:AraC-like DNA-binding protein